MNNPLEKLNTVVDAKLSESERSAMRADFSAYLDAHPVAEAVPSPYRFAYPAAFAFVFLLVVLPTGFAAERSLPGDVLYSLKTSTEDALVGLASLSSEETEARAHVTLVDRRLSEAELLIARGEGAEAELSLLADEVTESAETIGGLVDASSAGDEALIDAGEALEARLGAHHRIVEVLSEDTPSEAVTDFSEEMSLLEDDASETTDEAEARAEPDGVPASYDDAKEEASSALASLDTALSTADADAALTVEAAALFAEAKRLYAESIAMVTENESGATDLMESAGDAAREGLLVFEAGERLE